MTVYNEIAPYPAAWLRNLIGAGQLDPGEVRECSIKDLKPEDVQGRDFHAFAGIGVWAYALRAAGWSGPVWTGSCPCQPFSSAGRGRGFADERHLWPDWFKLIQACRPPVVFGEQVASKDGLAWLDTVYTDLEGENYSVRAVDICAAGVGAPHIRQRLYFVAYTDEAGRGFERGSRLSGHGETPRRDDVDGCGPDGGLSDTSSDGFTRTFGAVVQESYEVGTGFVERGATNGFWAGAEWIPCSDGKLRPTESGTFPLAHGAPARVGRLRAYGNALAAPLAIEFIRAARECLYG